jgi:hypothetical protein
MEPSSSIVMQDPHDLKLLTTSMILVDQPERRYKETTILSVFAQNHSLPNQDRLTIFERHITSLKNWWIH